MRLPALTELTPRQQEVSDAIAAKRGATRGPFLIWLRSPELAAKVDSLGAYCRFEASINERLRELSLLIAARHFDAQYSWNAHHKKAIEAGVTAYWYRFVGLEGGVVGIDSFGESAPAPDVFKHFGFTVENVVKTVERVMGGKKG